MKVLTHCRPFMASPMRLNPQTLRAIQQADSECFTPGARVRLFGSRLDDSRRGGDIDLLIEPPRPLTPGNLVATRNAFLARLYRLLGEQKIDVLIAPASEPDGRPVVRTAWRDGRVTAKVPASTTPSP